MSNPGETPQTTTPTQPAHEEEEHDETFNMTFKLLMLAAMIIVCFLGLIPLRIPTSKNSKVILSYLNTFSAGIFIAMALLHMLPEANNIYLEWIKGLHDAEEAAEEHEEGEEEDHDEHGEGEGEEAFPLPFTMVIFGFILVLLLDRVIMAKMRVKSSTSKNYSQAEVALKNFQKNKVTMQPEDEISCGQDYNTPGPNINDLVDEENNDINGLASPQPKGMDYSDENKDSLRMVQLNSEDLGGNAYKKSAKSVGTMDSLRKLQIEDYSASKNGYQDSSLKLNDATAEKDNKKTRTDQLIPVNVDPSVPSRNYSSFVSIMGKPQQKDQEKTVSQTSGLMLVIALGFHAFFEGLAFGLMGDFEDTWKLALGILIHKSAAAFSLGGTLAQSRYSVRVSTYFIGAFAIIAPIGIIIALVFEHFMEQLGAGDTSNLVNSCLLSVSAGTFLYVGMTEIVSKEFKTDKNTEKKGAQKNEWISFLCLLIGIFIVIGLWFLEGSHEHHAEHED